MISLQSAHYIDLYHGTEYPISIIHHAKENIIYSIFLGQTKESIGIDFLVRPCFV